MITAARIAGFAVALGVTFGAATLAGASLDPLRDSGAGHGHAPAAGAHGDGHTAAVVDVPAGLGVSEGGYTLAPVASTLPLGRPAELRFRILGPDGGAVTDFDVEHERRMHLIVVRRDLTGYQHVHPRPDGRGGWTVEIDFPAAGPHRVYADFVTSGRPYTLSADVDVAGDYAARPLPAPAATAAAGDGYEVAR